MISYEIHLQIIFPYILKMWDDFKQQEFPPKIVIIWKILSLAPRLYVLHF